MKKIYVSLFTLLSIGIASAQSLYVQDFGTLPAASLTTGSSETFVSSTPSGGGTYKFAVGSGGGGFALGTYAKAGTGTELQLTASNSTSINKFSVYGYSNPTTFSSLKLDLLVTGANGTFQFINGSGSSFSDNTSFDSTQSFSAIQCALGATSSTATVTQHVAGSGWVALGSGSIPTSVFGNPIKITIEIYCNNGSTTATYTRPGSATTYTVASNKWDVWASGMNIGDDIAKSGIADNSNINSWMVIGSNSTSNAGIAYVDNISYANSPSVTLSVELSAFTAKKVNEYVDVNWITRSESDIADFVVEKSIDGRNYETIAIVKPTNSNNGSNYSFKDYKLVSGTSYYRLQIIHKDGKIEYSAVAIVKDKSKTVFQILENPVRNQLTLKIDKEEASTDKIAIVDIAGRIVYSNSMVLNAGTTTQTISLKELRAGNYYVQYTSKEGVKTVAFLKQ